MSTCTIQVYTGVWIQWNGMVDWNAGMEWWNGMVEWNGAIECWHTAWCISTCAFAAPCSHNQQPKEGTTPLFMHEIETETIVACVAQVYTE